MSKKRLDPELRKEILERDNYECQFAKIFGIVELSGVPCVERKEVHHISYQNFGNETVDDLIVCCARCHDVITTYVRTLRFSTRELKVIETISKSNERPTERKKFDVPRITKSQV